MAAAGDETGANSPKALPALTSHQSGRTRGTRVLDPGCLALRAHRAVPLLTNSGVLGSPLWLFEHLPANQEGTQTKASKRSPTTQYKDAAVQTGECEQHPTWSQLPAGFLPPQVVCARAGRTRALESTGSRQSSTTSGQPYPSRQCKHGAW